MNDKVYNAMFGARVRYYRERNKMTQKDLADKVGYTVSATIGRIEKGQQTIPLSKLPDFCLALGVEPYDLIGMSETDKKVWMIAEDMSAKNRDSDIQKFIDLYLRMLKGGGM